MRVSPLKFLGGIPDRSRDRPGTAWQLIPIARENTTHHHHEAMRHLDTAPIISLTNRINRAGAKLVLVEVANYDGEEGFMICAQAHRYGKPVRKAVQFNADLNAALISLQTGDFLGFTC